MPRTLAYLFLIAAACLLSAPTPAAEATAAPARGDTMAAGRALTRAFLDGDLATVYARFGQGMRDAMDAASLAAFRKKVDQQLGEEKDVLSEEPQRVDGLDAYVRMSRWSKVPVTIRTQWVFAPDGKVAAFSIQPTQAAQVEAASPYLDRDTIADLRLPFEGKWHVFWGGRTLAQNYHAADPGQRFAYDFVKRVGGSTHRGDGSALDQYYCWDQPILAPAPGTVVERVGDLPDQAIGTANPRQPAGNHVMLDLGHGEYALLAHLRKGSIVVEPGQAVTTGDLLGRCGNSGNTSEPHLHFHLQDSPRFGNGLGLPAFFNDYVADGRPVAHGEPLRGQTIESNPVAGTAPANKGPRTTPRP